MIFFHRRTKTWILEHNWLEYIQHLKNFSYQHDGKPEPRPSEKGFWKWYIDKKLSVGLL